MKSLLFFLLLGIAVAGCNGINTIKTNLRGLSPYEEYVRNLESANLQNRPMVRKWIEAGEKSMNDSVKINLPFVETGHFLSHYPDARSYRFNAADGQVITVNGAIKTLDNAKFFADLFIWKDDAWKHVASSDSSLTMRYELNQNTSCLLRIQPELLVNAYYSLSIGLTPVLINPVLGANNRSIQSYYGASRDGGKRKHEGIDIFAKKGTPIVAPTHGTVTRVGYGKLGGKVVWMYDRKRGHSYYFAHLDSQYVTPGVAVKQGDTLGTVGNTGNARYTPPHLHFGIYQTKSKDPLYFVKTLEAMEQSIAVDTTMRHQPFKVIAKKSVLRYGPSDTFDKVREVEKETFVTILAQSRNWYRVALADEKEGFILKKEVSEAKGGRLDILNAPKELMADISDRQTVVKYLSPNSKVEPLAKHYDFTYVRTTEGLEGWIN